MKASIFRTSKSKDFDSLQKSYISGMLGNGAEHSNKSFPT